MNQRELAARRQLLVATAVMQRVRLAHDMTSFRNSVEPPRWAAAALLGAAVLATVLAFSASRRAAPRAPASQWWVRGLALWRAVTALRCLLSSTALRGP